MLILLLFYMTDLWSVTKFTLLNTKIEKIENTVIVFFLKYNMIKRTIISLNKLIWGTYCAVSIASLSPLHLFLTAE